MTFLIGLALKFGISQRFAKYAVIGALIALLIALLGVGKCAYDKRIIRTHNLEREAATAKADRKADAKAAEERRADDQRTATETTEIKEAIDEARSKGTDPRAAYYKCVGLQQAARASGKPPPDC